MVSSDPDCGFELLAYSPELMLIRGLAATAILLLGFVWKGSTACYQALMTQDDDENAMRIRSDLAIRLHACLLSGSDSH